MQAAPLQAGQRGARAGQLKGTALELVFNLEPSAVASGPEGNPRAGGRGPGDEPPSTHKEGTPRPGFWTLDSRQEQPRKTPLGPQCTLYCREPGGREL